MSAPVEQMSDAELLDAIEQAGPASSSDAEVVGHTSELRRRADASADSFTPAAKAFRRTTAVWPSVDVPIVTQIRRVRILVDAGLTRRDLSLGGCAGHVDRIANQVGMPSRRRYRTREAVSGNDASPAGEAAFQ